MKFVHVLSAIVAVGFNLSYGVLTSRSAKEPEHELHVLETIKVLDARFANVGYAPLIRRQLAILQADGPSSPEYRRLAARAKRLGVTLSLNVVGIVFLMVTKPTI